MWFKKEKKKKAYILLDRSGSMSVRWPDTIGGLNSYVEKLEDDVEILIAAFDGGASALYNNSLDIQKDYHVVRDTTVKDFKSISASEIFPRGSTPLYDAAGKIMQHMLTENREKAVLIIITDGEENSSKEFRLADVKAKLATLEEKNWPVVYLGSEFKEVESYATGTFGIRLENTTAYSRSRSSQTMGLMANKTEAYFNEANTAFASAHMTITEQEKEELKKEV